MTTRLHVTLAVSVAVAAACLACSSSTTTVDSGSDGSTPGDSGAGDSSSASDAGHDAARDGAIDAPADAAPDPTGCTETGGTVSSALCCSNTGDFPNNCLTGACSCGPTSSKAVQVCLCGEGRCFNGSGCMTR